jgi:crotonobetainyl-CoA:carnitine CoA-transferase CaiB-like acyl-CoA transferase
MQGKDSICIDLTTPDGVAIVHRLAARADLVLQGYRAGAAERHHVDAETLRALNPDLVYLHAPGYGAGPPNGHRPAFAPSMGAAAGIARANVGASVPERADLTIEEIRDGSRRLQAAGTAMTAQADGLAAVGVATALLLGLVARERGAGAQAMLGSMLVTATHAMVDHVMTADGATWPRMPDGELRGTSACHRIYDASDGWIFLAAPGERDWQRLVAALAADVDLATDDRFGTEADRRRHDAALADVLSVAFAKRGKDDWERDLLAAGVGCVAVTTGPVESVLLGEAFGTAHGFVVEVEHPVFERHPRLAPLVQFSRSATEARPGGLAGNATDRILGELGFGPAEIADLRQRRIVG